MKVWLGVGLAILAAATFAGSLDMRLRTPVPPPRELVSVPAPRPAPSVSLSFSWPGGLESAVALPGVTRNPIASHGGDRPIPVASLAKLMTAFLILRDHPLTLGVQGPTLTMTLADLQIYNQDVVEDQSSIQVKVGERLTEYQLLQALLVRSANNIASLLAQWDSGSVSRFVAKMNAAAKQLGLPGTHFADASGFSNQTVSNASSIAKLASIDMQNPVFRQLVNEPSVNLPVIGELPNIVRRVGTGVVVGVKSGYTIWSGGCVAIALAVHTAFGHLETPVAVVLGVQGAASLHRAANAASQLASEVVGGVVRVGVVAKGEVIGSITVPWLKGGGKVRLVTAAALSTTAFSKQMIRFSYRPVKMRPTSIPRGTVAGYLLVSTPTDTRRVEVVTSRTVAGPSLSWRVLDN